jgi:predicted dehydrogenase
VNFWTRQFPAVKWMRQLVHDGALGDILQTAGDVSFSRLTDQRLINKTMGGGALLDVGCYQLQYATMFNDGKFPDQFSAFARLNAQGVDADIAMNLAWGAGSARHLATFTTGTDKNGLSAIMMIGTLGRFEIHNHFNCPDTVFFYQNKPNGAGDMQSELAFFSTNLSLNFQRTPSQSIFKLLDLLTLLMLSTWHFREEISS